MAQAAKAMGTPPHDDGPSKSPCDLPAGSCNRP